MGGKEQVYSLKLMLNIICFWSEIRAFSLFMGYRGGCLVRALGYFFYGVCVCVCVRACVRAHARTCVHGGGNE